MPRWLKTYELFSAMFVSTLLSLGIVSLDGFSQPSYALQEKSFKNCAALNKVYPGGVAKNNKVSNKGGATKYAPSVKPKIYKANASKDRDKDGIACER